MTHKLSEPKIRTADITHAAASAAPAASFSRAIRKLRESGNWTAMVIRCKRDAKFPPSRLVRKAASRCFGLRPHLHVPVSEIIRLQCRAEELWKNREGSFWPSHLVA